jgi:signal transduction histidine kinase
MAQREMSLVRVETEAPATETSGVWPVSKGDQSHSMAFAVHDAKNMLGALHANVHWLRSTLDSPGSRSDAVEVIGDMEACCERLSNLLCQALLVSRGPELEISPSRVNVSALVNNAVRQVRKQAQLRGVTVCARSGADVLTMIDALLVSRVLDNLLSNAVTHSSDGGRVSIEFDMVEDCVVFVVADEGPGIPDDVRERLFEPYVTERRRAVPETSMHVGLGLAFCKAVARAHGGDIAYTNRPSGGAEFVVSIPWVRPNPLSRIPR